MKIDLYGKNKIKTPKAIDIMLGTKADLGNPSDSKFDQVKFPTEKNNGPKYSI